MGWGSTLGSVVGGVGLGVATMNPAMGVMGAGIGGSVGGMLDGDAADAAKRAAEEQQAAAAAYMAQVQRNKEQAVGLVMTPANLAASDQALHGQEANVRRQEALVASLDPAIIEAGKQAKQLLDGRTAPVLNQLTEQRARQRQQMVSQLTQRLGPGATTSSAGLQALQKFDQDTSAILNQTQQQYLQQVSNIGLGGAQTLGQSLSQVHSTLQSIQANSPQAEAARIMTGFQQAEGQAAGAMINAAGGEQMGKVLKSQQEQALFGQVTQLGAAVYGANTMADAYKSKNATPGGEDLPLGPGETKAAYGSQQFGPTYNAGMGAAPAGTLASTVRAPAAPKAATLYDISGAGAAPASLQANKYTDPYVDPRYRPLNMNSFGYSPGRAASGWGSTAGE